MQMDIAVVGGAPGTPKHLYQPWDGNVGSKAAPNGATALHASSGNQANAPAVATLPAVAGVTNYVTGFMISAGGATAAALVVATLTGLLGGTASIVYGAVLGATLADQPVIVTFPNPIPASAVNTAIVLTLPALGAGNTNAVVELFGYQL